jgi:CHAT domain-containing protein/tetratricopeptide (TPR) repeat protein
MKKYCLLFILSVFSFVSFSQDIKKQIEDLDTAYYHDDYVTAKKLIAILSPDAETKIKDSKDLVEFYGTCGSVYYGTNEFKDAENYFTLASERAKKLLPDSDYHYSLAIFNLASCYKEEGRYAEAEPLYIKALPVLSNAFGQTSVEYTRCFYTLGSMYIDMGKYDYAEGMIAVAVNFYKEILGQDSPDYLGALGSIALVYQGQGKYAKAEEIFLALKNYHQSQPNPDTETLQTLENNLGELYRNMGDYTKAEACMLEAVKLAKENSISAATSYNNLALTQKSLGRYSEAEASYKKSISIYKYLNKTNHPDYTNPVNNLGELYRIMGRMQEAVNAFEEVIAIRKKSLGTDHPNYANALNNLALVEFAIGRYPDAEKHLLECKDIYKKTLGDKDKFYANCLNNLASVYKVEGNLPKAEENYLECLKIYKETYGETSDKYGVYLGGLAGTYRKMKKYDECIDLTKKSLEIIKNKLGENHYDYIETDYNLAETYREHGDFKEAEKHYLTSIKGYLFLIEKYFPSLSEQEKTAFYYTVSTSFETYNSFVIQMTKEFPNENHDVLISRMYDNQLVIKSLLLKETGKIKIQVAASENKALKEDYDKLLKMRESIVQQYRLSAEDLLETGIDLPKMEKDANELEQKITSASNISIKNDNTKNPSWKDIQVKLKTDECVVEIIRTEFYTKGEWTDSIYYSALVIDKTCVTPKFVFIKNGNDLESTAVAKYREAMKAKTEDDISYNAFWKPLKQAVGASKKIYFSPDGVYQQVNMYTLKNPETKKYLIEETNISLVTNSEDVLQSSPASTSKSAEIFSYPDYDFIPKTMEIASAEPLSRYGFNHLVELPGTKIEADTITNILRSKNWKVNEHLQAEATEGAIKKINNPKILHIATHGFFLKDVDENAADVIGLQSKIVKENPLLRSGLMLAGAAAVSRDSIVDNTKEDGILTAYEAAGLNLAQTDLVVLSACETGLGEVINGQGVYGLQRAFMVAGAKSVIMSLWVVDDFATQELMSNFYREWLKDPTADNKQKAFRTAQLKLKEKFPQPYYWGAFVMVGK